ncbi:DUF373 family protein [Candidatus Bathyarchaeota archaeon]|nr:DUF373 family protein [Candidatus Bathyarchaeota archaeon]
MNSKDQGEQAQKQKRILILCVDKDGDLVSKADIKTPVVGRDNNLNAAVALALKDPEEADANAMFEAVRLHDRLTSEGNPDETFEVATIAGSELGGVSSDRKIVSELTEVLKAYPADEVILVTDGYSDEVVLPLVESRVPVSSIRRVVVRHSESIEETAALFTRYLKLLVEDPRYSRLALGLPGVLLLLLGVLSAFGLVHYYLMAFIIVLGLYLFVKGFGVDRLALKFYNWLREYSPPPLRVQISLFSALAGFLCVIVGVYLGWSATAAIDSSWEDLISTLPYLTGVFIGAAKDLVIVGVCLALSGRAIRWYFERDARVLRNIALIILIGWSRQILDATSKILINPEIGYGLLIFTIIVGILLGLASLLVIVVVHRSAKKFFKRAEEVEELEDFEED